jgi:hypothetical protein
MKRLIGAVIGVFFVLAAVAVRAAGWLPLVSTPAGGCSQATTYNAALDSSQNSAAVTTLICGLVTDGVFAKLDVLYLFAINSQVNALVNAVSPGTFNGTANGSPTFSANNGFTGVAASTTVYIDTGFNPNTQSGSSKFALASAHVSCWSFTNVGAGIDGHPCIGETGVGANVGSIVQPHYLDNNFYVEINSAQFSPAANANSTGHYIGNISASGAQQGYKNGALAGSGTGATTTLGNADIVVLASNNSGTGVSSGSPMQISMASIGGSLSSTDVTNFYNRLCTYLTTVHGAC